MSDTTLPFSHSENRSCSVCNSYVCRCTAGPTFLSSGAGPFVAPEAVEGTHAAPASAPECPCSEPGCRIFERGRQSAGLTFAALNEQNTARATRWHPGFPEEDDWTGGDWAAAMAGECGEACNIVKKLRRVETAKRGRESERDVVVLREKLGAELADLIIYADLLAAKYGITLAEAVRDKFNEVSDQYDFPEYLDAA